MAVVIVTSPCLNFAFAVMQRVARGLSATAHPCTIIMRKHDHHVWPQCNSNLYKNSFIMVALCNRADHYVFALWFISIFFFFSSPNLSGRRLDVYHTSTHGVALMQI